MVTSQTDQYTKRLSCIHLHDHTNQAKPNLLGFGVMSMEWATQDGYITHRSKQEKIILHQPSWSYASSINQPSWRWRYQHGKSYTRWLYHTPINTRKDYHASTFMIIRIKHNPTIWRWSYQHGKSYTRWLHHTLINTRKDYHASTFMIIRVKHNPTILALELSTRKELHKMVISHTDQYTKRLSCINLHDHTHQAQPNRFRVGVINMEGASQNGYITHRSIHEMIIMHQPSWSYALSKTQPSWLWSYEHGKSYTRWLHHTSIKTRKDYLASTFMIIRVKHKPTILALKISTWKELHKMVISHTDQYTKRLSRINLLDHTRQA